MNSGKSIELLKVAHNYEEQGKRVTIFTSSLDSRDGVGQVVSRIGIKKEAVPVDRSFNLCNYVGRLDYTPHCVLVDEAQFLTRVQVRQLALIVDDFNIPVIAFGLKNDFSNHLFEGSEALLLYADKLEEMKTICWYCDRKATMVLRFQDGEPVYEGEQIQIGGNDKYKPVCRRCWMNGGGCIVLYEK
jgi:thymidine kinase